MFSAKIFSLSLSVNERALKRAISSAASHIGKSVPKKNFSVPNFLIRLSAFSLDINGSDELVLKYTLSSPA